MVCYNNFRNFFYCDTFSAKCKKNLTFPSYRIRVFVFCRLYYRIFEDLEKTREIFFSAGIIIICYYLILRIGKGFLGSEYIWLSICCLSLGIMNQPIFSKRYSLKLKNLIFNFVQVAGVCWMWKSCRKSIIIYLEKLAYSSQSQQ